MSERELRIFAGLGERRRPFGRGTRELAAEDVPEAAEEAEGGDPALDRRLLDIIAAPAEWGETVEATFRRKELALAESFAALAPAEACALYRRLVDAEAESQPGNQDRLAAAFRRLVPQRRDRLLAFLAAAPRRRACMEGRS